MSKVTFSALRGLSVAAGTVGLAAVGAAVAAGQACAAEPGPALAGGGLPVATNALPAVVGAMAHNHGTIAGIPLSNLPLLGQLPGMLDNASPTKGSLPGLGYADLGEAPLTRGRTVPGAEGVRTTYVARHATAAHGAPVAGRPSSAPVPSVPPPPPASMPQAPAPTAAPAPAGVPKAQTGPLDGVTNVLHGLPLADNLPLSGLAGALGGLTGRLDDFGG